MQERTITMTPVVTELMTASTILKSGVGTQGFKKKRISGTEMSQMGNSKYCPHTFVTLTFLTFLILVTMFSSPQKVITLRRWVFSIFRVNAINKTNK